MKRILLISLTLFAVPAFAAPGTPYSDEWIEGRISGALSYNPTLDSSDIDVDSDGGLVTLKGDVGSLVERDFAGAIAGATDGVKNVKNELKVDENLKLKTRSSFGQKLTDASITAGVKTRLLANKNVSGLKINVDTAGNVVTLSGEVKNDAERLLAAKLAANTSGVRSVKNSLIVKADAGSERAKMSESKDLGTAVSDAWITSQIRTYLTFSGDFPGSDVSVSTANGMVTLDGYARNAQQKTLIEQEIMEFSGVKSVKSNLVIPTLQ